MGADGLMGDGGDGGGGGKGDAAAAAREGDAGVAGTTEEDGRGRDAGGSAQLLKVRAARTLWWRGESRPPVVSPPLGGGEGWGGRDTGSSASFQLQH